MGVVIVRNLAMENFTEEEQNTILEIARIALSDGEIFDGIADKLDLSDKDLKDLQEKIEKATS